MKFKVSDGEGRVIISSGNDELFETHSSSFIFNNNNYKISLETESTDEKKSSRLRKSFAEVVERAAISVLQAEQGKFDQYNHIIQTISSQIIQKIDGYYGNERWYSNDYSQALDNIESFLKNNPRESARLIHYFNKMSIDMKSHIEGWDIIYVKNEYAPKLTEVSLKKAITNQLSSFAEDFQDLKIVIQFDDYFTDENTVPLDKKLFSLIMYNFFSNALKYSIPEGAIRFKYNPDTKLLNISMYSIRIEKNEMNKIFEEGSRGQNANSASSSGNGSGLYVIKKALRLMSLPNMYIDPKWEKTKTWDNTTYVENHFIFDFNTSK